MTLLRTPSQPVAPVAAIDLSRSAFCTTSIQPSDDSVILYAPLCTGAGASINPANVLFDFGVRSGVTGNFTSLKGSSVTIVANGSGHVARLPEVNFGKSVPVLQIGSIELEWETKVARLEGRPVELSAREWAVIEVLGRRPQSTVSKEQIEDALYAFGEEIESNTIEVYVSRIRRKLGRDFIRTIRGLGYRLGD